MAVINIVSDHSETIVGNSGAGGSLAASAALTSGTSAFGSSNLLVPTYFKIAFANIYKDLAEAINSHKEHRDIDPSADLYPRAEDGLRSMAAVFAVAKSGKQNGAWLDARPPMFR